MAVGCGRGMAGAIQLRVVQQIAGCSRGVQQRGSAVPQWVVRCDDGKRVHCSATGPLSRGRTPCPMNPKPTQRFPDLESLAGMH